MLVLCLMFLTVSCMLLAAFSIGPVPQEILLSPVHLVRYASKFKSFPCHILWHGLPGFESPSTHFHRCGPLKVTRWCISCVFCVHLVFQHRLRDLDGQLIKMLSVWNILFMPPGMITRSHFSRHGWTFTFYLVWPWELSETSTNTGITVQLII
jgi:hypothetical protein